MDPKPLSGPCSPRGRLQMASQTRWPVTQFPGTLRTKLPLKGFMVHILYWDHNGYNRNNRMFHILYWDYDNCSGNSQIVPLYYIRVTIGHGIWPQFCVSFAP